MVWLAKGGGTLGPNANHQSLPSDGDCGFWSHHANSFAPTSCLRQANGATGQSPLPEIMLPVLRICLLAPDPRLLYSLSLCWMVFRITLRNSSNRFAPKVCLRPSGC